MIKILIGGSPCTFWSIAQKKHRETAATGQGWELFKNYLIAKEKFKPDFFLYENNKSAAEEIKAQIRQELGVTSGAAHYIEIDSALLSAQNRKRFYVYNGAKCPQPQDANIKLQNILQQGKFANVGEVETVKKNIPKIAKKKGYLPEFFNPYNASEITDKAPTLSTGSMVTSSCATLKFERQDDGKYEAKNGFIYYGGAVYPTTLADGFYIIRQLTVTECCRLQTLPDDYCRIASNSQAYKAIGNGWTAAVIVHILSTILKDIPRSEEIIVLSMYDGIGTGRYCFEKMGFTNIKYFAYEIDERAKAIAQSNFPDIIQRGDAFAVRERNWHL